jgi:predicted DNA-binding antitoxin AbrB/MazE fold protein
MNYYILIRKVDVMQKTIEAVYENGVLKPFAALDLKEHEKVKIFFEKIGSAARTSSGILKGLDNKTIMRSPLLRNFYRRKRNRAPLGPSRRNADFHRRQHFHLSLLRCFPL